MKLYEIKYKLYNDEKEHKFTATKNNFIEAITSFIRYSYEECGDELEEIIHIKCNGEILELNM